ncbi:TRAP transporter small permease [Rhodobacteraceae bacterium N5(2021)]|uniref:TRAP transporter small permease protein n=1 Tax=Gymnodinialimonas phycosphaerae TaxID=2841589 RepID=A0A975TWQ4_9RHOB|nr:TRAP transporter small permease [Gymnodinialimonas phycosphaerae]MBY4891829.1 TRAP transporter small permease [Gymnodinialimonas phycosphaerae]
MDLVRTIADRLIGLSALIGSIALAVLVGVILADVIGSQFGMPIYGALDVTIMSMVIVVFGGMALCDRRGGHISVDLLERSFPPALNRAIDSGSAVLGAVIFVTLAWAVYESAQISEMLNLSTNLLRLPKAWFQYALCGLAIFTALGMVLRAVEIAFTGRDVRRDETHLQ